MDIRCAQGSDIDTIKHRTILTKQQDDRRIATATLMTSGRVLVRSNYVVLSLFLIIEMTIHDPLYSIKIDASRDAKTVMKQY